MPPGAPAPREYIGQALKALVMHEVGHTLGLRHNFRGSAGVSAEELADRSHTERHGHGVSVMDYSPPALALDPRRQGHFYSPTIGTYDRWAITYGYASAGDGPPESADRHAGPPTPRSTPPGGRLPRGEPGHLYASDEDAGFGAAGLDPTVSRYDMTDDPLSWAQDRVTLIDRLFDSLETRVVAPGQGYGRLRAAFGDLLTDRWYALLVSTKYLGGATTARDHRGDPDARPALSTVPADRQREALAFIAEAGFGEDAFQFRPDLLRQLAPERWMHWGSPPGRPGPGGLPGARLGPGPAGFPARAIAGPGGPLPDSRRRAPCPARRADIVDPRAVRRPSPARSGPSSASGPARSRARPRNIGSVRRDAQRLHLNA